MNPQQVAGWVVVALLLILLVYVVVHLVPAT